VAGDTTITDDVAPVFQEYVETPDAVSVALCPEQIVLELTAIDGAEVTVTVTVVEVPTQPAVLVPFTE
jgi:hypothetical protein